MRSNTILSEDLSSECLHKFNTFIRVISEKELFAKADTTLMEELKTVFRFSDFIYTSLVNNPQILSDLIETKDLKRIYHPRDYDSKVKQSVGSALNNEETGILLRQLRRREMVRIAWRDILNLSDLRETLRDLSSFADACIRAVISKLHRSLRKKYGIPIGKDGTEIMLIPLSMGKLGAGELNFSSDIDLVFIYPDSGNTSGIHDDSGSPSPGTIITNEEFFTMLARQFLKIIGETGIDGLVFRVDLKLRPYGDSGPIIMSIDALEDYFIAQGREWERYAYIKARAVCGKIKDIQRLDKIIQAFVYRKYIDYANFDTLRDMKQHIFNEISRKGIKKNIKIGAGGIREIEFFGQIFQLIRGGIEPELREKKILPLLDLLTEKGYIPELARDELKDAYIFLRYTEHRLQEWQDAQTHTLPSDPLEEVRLAESMDFDCPEHFFYNLQSHMKKVRHHVSQLLVDTEEDSSFIEDFDLLKKIWHHVPAKQETIHLLSQAGFKEAREIYSIIDYLKNDINTRNLSIEGKDRLSKLIPLILNKIRYEEASVPLLNQITDLIKTIEGRTCYIALLIENPTVIDRLIKLTKESPWIITYLTKHPVLLDELLDNRMLYAPPDKDQMKEELAWRVNKVTPGDLEGLIEEMCIFKQVNTMRVAVSDISGAFHLRKVSDYLTDIAEVILESVCDISWLDMIVKHGEVLMGDSPLINKNQFAVIGFGKFGGIELGYGSDLDLVFIHSADSDINMDAQNSLDKNLIYCRLGQKIIHLLTARTTAGYIYDVDMRLRPSGDSGPIVTHVNSLKEYYETSAWTWEHQALVRARPICGDPALFSDFYRLRKQILCQKRDHEELGEEILAMREKMKNGHRRKETGLFHLKQDDGGIIDIEFLVQFLVLANAFDHPEITEWTDNIHLLDAMTKHGILEAYDSTRLKDAFIIFRKRIHEMNLMEKTPTVPADELSDHRKAVISIRNKYFNVPS